MDERQPHVEAGHPLTCLHDHVGDLIGEERRLRKPHHLVHGEPRISQNREQHSWVVVLEKKGALGSVRPHREKNLLHLRQTAHPVPRVLTLLWCCFLFLRGSLHGHGRSGQESSENLVRIPFDSQGDSIRQHRDDSGGHGDLRGPRAAKGYRESGVHINAVDGRQTKRSE